MWQFVVQGISGGRRVSSSIVVEQHTRMTVMSTALTAGRLVITVATALSRSVHEIFPPAL